jgi:predicted nucleic acid-binding protein
MTLLVDTSVWSLALRRDTQTLEPQVRQLKKALLGSEIIVTTGLILQELLQGFLGPKAQTQIVERFAALPTPSARSGRPHQRSSLAQHLPPRRSPDRYR